MTSAGTSQSSTWHQIHRLGENILNANLLHEQRDLIEKAAEVIPGAKATLWLDENLFRLPGLNQKKLFATHPPAGLMRTVYTGPENIQYEENGKTVAIGLRSQGLSLGVLKICRFDGDKFNSAEVGYIETLTGHAAMALVAAHRFAVEQWRVDQLTLVRSVSAQIANVLDPQLLTRRVTRLILDTFKFYYVAIFTIKAGQKQLEFWSSAGPGKRSTRRGSKSAIKVELGQGLIGQAAENGQEIISNNVSNEPYFRQLEPLPGTQSEVVLPMKVGNRLLGILDIQSERLNAFHPNDLLVLRALADSIALSLNSTQLYADLEGRANQLSIIAEVSRDITSILELGELLAKVAALISEKLKFPHVYLYTVHSNRRQIIFEAGNGSRMEALQGFTISLDSEEGMIPWAARTGEVILANDVREEPRYKLSPFLPENTLAELTLPLLYDNKPIGVLDLQSDRINAFKSDDLIILAALADNVAVAIHNADLYRTERWRRQVADSLREVAGLLSADAGVDDVLDRVLHELEHNLPCDTAAAWLLDEEELYLAHIHGIDMDETEAARQRWPEANQYLLSILNTSQPVVRKPADPFEPTGIAHGYSADYSSISVALRTGERPLGVITLSHHSSGRYGHEAQAVTSTFANYAAVSIENARLYDSAQEQAYASAALLQVAQTVVNSNNMDETIASVIRVTPILVGVKACAIYLWGDNHFHAGRGYGFPEEVEAILCGKIFQPGEFPLLDSTREKGEMIVGVLTPAIAEDWIDPVLAHNDQETTYALQTSEHLLIGFPLIIRNDFFGAMIIQEEADDLRFREKRIEIINGITQQVAMSIQNDQLKQEMVARERFEHEIQLARQIQRTFLPENLPELAEWELAATWRTAREVGGDFYDVIELPGKRLGLLIADVSDKGIPAALFMALTRTVVRATVLDTDSPAEVMQRVNELIIRDNREGMFVTLVYGVLSLESGKFTYANAGHNPPVWIVNTPRTYQALHRTGAALGVIEGLEMEERTIRIEDGDSLLLYTDGLTEAFSPNDEIFGVERINAVISAEIDPSAQDLLKILEDTLDKFIGPIQPADDLTMLAIKRKKQA